MVSLSIFAPFAFTGSRSPLVSFASQKDTASIANAGWRHLDHFSNSNYPNLNLLFLWSFFVISPSTNSPFR